MNRRHADHRLLLLLLAGALLGSPSAAAAEAPAASENDDPAVYPEIALPAPTGTHQVGTRRFVLVDSKREETYSTETGDPRELLVQFWYPSAEGQRSVVPYMDDATAGVWVDRHGFPEGFHRRVRTHAAENAPMVDTGDLPLLLFSHGLSWPAQMYQAFFEELASHGYAVAAVNHTFGSDMVVFPDGRSFGFGLWDEPEPDEELRNEQLADHLVVWVEDLRFVLDEISARRDSGEPFYSRLDLSRTGAFGHSYGGTAVARLLATDPRVRAAAAMEGLVYRVEERPLALARPFMYLLAAYNTAEASGSQYRTRDAPYYEVAIRGIFHPSFSDLIYLHLPKADRAWRERNRYLIDPERGLRLVEHYLVAFFDRFLRGTDSELLHPWDPVVPGSSRTAGLPEVELRIDY